MTYSESRPDYKERRNIRDAMDRLMEGRPIRSDGKLTIKSLAEEAGVKRWLLTHKHTDLQDEFRARISTAGEIPEAQKKLAAEAEKLKERLQTCTEKLLQAEAELVRYARVVHVQSLENNELQQHLGELLKQLALKRTEGQSN